MKRFLQQLIRKFGTPRRSTVAAPRPQRVRLTLECLEEREVFSIAPLTTLAAPETKVVTSTVVKSPVVEPIQIISTPTYTTPSTDGYGAATGDTSTSGGSYGASNGTTSTSGGSYGASNGSTSTSGGSYGASNGTTSTS